MKKYFVPFLLGIALSLPLSVFGAPSSVNRLTDHIEPLIPGDFIKGLYFTGTSTSQASIFPLFTSTNGTSTNSFATSQLCLTGDSCRTTWPTGGGSGSNWSNFSGFITPSTTVGITVNSSSSILALSLVNATATNATATNLFATNASTTLLNFSNATGTLLSLAGKSTNQTLVLNSLVSSLSNAANTTDIFSLVSLGTSVFSLKAGGSATFGQFTGTSGVAGSQLFLSDYTIVASNTLPQIVGNWNASGVWGIGADNITNQTVRIGLATNTRAYWSLNQSGAILAVGSSTFGNNVTAASSTFGQLTATSSTFTNATTTTGFFSNASTTFATTTFATIRALFDDSGGRGTNGQILSSNGSTTAWISSSTLAFISSLNGLTAAVQNFATTSNAGGWGWASSGFTHTLNIPTAGASTVLGLLSNTDWSTFNAKESVLSFTAPLSRSVNTISCIMATASVTGCLSNTDWNTFNSKIATTSLDTSAKVDGIVTDNTGSGALVFAGSPTFTGTPTFTNLFSASSSLQSFFGSSTVVTNATHTNLFSTNVSAQNSTTTGIAYFGNSIGIGTSSPFSALSVVGSEYVTGNSTTTNLTATGTINFTALSTGCVQSTAGVITSTGVACGSGGGGSSFGKSWEVFGTSPLSWLAPTTTIGTIVSASSTYTGGLSIDFSTTTSATTTTGFFSNASTTFATTTFATIRALFDNTGSRGTNGQLLTSNGSTTAWASTSTLAYLSSLNGLTAPYQAFATSSPASGGWGITSSVSTHTLTIPTAGATSPLGLLSSTDWTTFNSKAPTASPSFTGTVTVTGNISATGFIGTDKLSGFQQDSLLLGYASSTNKDTIFGFRAGGSNATTSATTGTLTAIGYQALSNNTTGIENTTVGYQAGSRVTTGSDNTAVGMQSMMLLTTGSANNAVGHNSLQAATLGSQNNAMGDSSLINLLGGGKNVGVGGSSLFSDTAGSGNVAIGYSSGASITTGSDNIYIGHEEGTGGGNTATGNNNIMIGYNAVATSSAAVNFLNIGNFLFGTIPATTSATVIALPLKGAIGIASTSPNATLSVHANAGSTLTDLFVIGSSTITATTTHFRVTNTGTIFAPNTSSSAAAQTGAWCYNASGEFIRESAVCTVSARKFKKDITLLDVGISDVMKISFVSYFKKVPLNEQDSHRQMGVIADDVSAISPALDEMLVTRDSNGDIHGFRYDQFTALLGKAIQDQQKEIEALSGKAQKSATDNYQWIIIGLLALWIVRLEIKK